MKMEYCQLYTCLRRLMRLSRWFGVFPLEGLNSNSISGLRFKLKSFYGLLWSFSFLGQFVMATVSFCGLMTSHLTLAMVAHMIFYSASFATTVLLIILSKNWPTLLKEISQIEQEVGIKWNKSTELNIFLLTIFILFCAAVEHVLLYWYIVYFAMKCFQDMTFSYYVMDLLVTLKFQYFLRDQPPEAYQVYVGALFEFINAQAVFLSNLVDIMVISHSVYLGACFRALNKRIESERNKQSANWNQLRTQYARLVILLKKIDKHLSFFVLIAVFTSLFFTVVQLFNSLSVPNFEFGNCDYVGAREAITSQIHNTYYWFSFIFRFTRTFIVCVMTANVHTYAFEPIWFLGEVHASMYNKEIQRFYRQITYTTVGVNGVFFYVTRGMILKVLGTLITYELVLLQFALNSSRETDTTPRVQNFTSVNETNWPRVGYERRFTFNY